MIVLLSLYVLDNDPHNPYFIIQLCNLQYEVSSRLDHFRISSSVQKPFKNKTSFNWGTFRVQVKIRNPHYSQKVGNDLSSCKNTVSLRFVFVGGSTASDIWRTVITFDINTEAGLFLRNTRVWEELIWKGCRLASTHSHVWPSPRWPLSVCTSALKSVFSNRTIDLRIWDSSSVIKVLLNLQMLLNCWPSGCALSPQSIRVEGLNSWSPICSLWLCELLPTSGTCTWV